MHDIIARVQDLCNDALANKANVSDELIEEFGELAKQVLRKHFQPQPDREFTIRMSNIGRPLCQLWMEKNGVQGESPSPWEAIKFAYGDLVEALAYTLMRASGVNVEQYQTPVALEVGPYVVKGTLDTVIDGKVYDIKSASEWSFQNKFLDGSPMDGDDPFGYETQGLMYASATGLPFGGWIVVNKSSGEWTICEYGLQGNPNGENQSSTSDEHLNKDELSIKINSLVHSSGFVRNFWSQPEFYRKKATGNFTLTKTCEFCPFKWECWPGLIYKEATESTAANKPMRYYTHIASKDNDEDNNSVSKS